MVETTSNDTMNDLRGGLGESTMDRADRTNTLKNRGISHDDTHLDILNGLGDAAQIVSKEEIQPKKRRNSSHFLDLEDMKFEPPPLNNFEINASRV